MTVPVEGTQGVQGVPGAPALGVQGAARSSVAGMQYDPSTAADYPVDPPAADSTSVPAMRRVMVRGIDEDDDLPEEGAS